MAVAGHRMHPAPRPSDVPVPPGACHRLQPHTAERQLEVATTLASLVLDISVPFPSISPLFVSPLGIREHLCSGNRGCTLPGLVPRVHKAPHARLGCARVLPSQNSPPPPTLLGHRGRVWEHGATEVPTVSRSGTAGW